MVEGARLESVYMGNCIEGSNPFLSAESHCKSPTILFCRAFLFFAIAKPAMEQMFLNGYASGLYPDNLYV